MLSLQRVAQPNPSYPARCRQDTTSSMEHRLQVKHLLLKPKCARRFRGDWRVCLGGLLIRGRLRQIVA